MIARITVSRAVLAALIVVVVFAQAGYAQRNREKQPELTPEENARVLLLKYYPETTLVNVFPSMFNKPGSKDGRYAATVTQGSDGWLKVVDMKNRDIVEIFEARYSLQRVRNLTAGFTHSNEHVIAIWPELDEGKQYSSFEIFSLEKRISRSIFTLTKVENLMLDFVDGDTLVLVQRWPNIINLNESVRPSKAIYFILGADGDKGYTLVPHLTRLPGEDLDVSARLNNQAIEHYNRGNLRKAEDVLRKVVDMRGPGVAVSRRNMTLIQREIEALEMQKIAKGNVMVTPNYDDARLAFFTGDYNDCIDIIRSQGRKTTGDKMIMLAVSYAQSGLWGELDAIDRALAKGDPGFRKEYLSYMVDILQGLNDQARYLQYLKEFETVDENHPNLLAHKALILTNKGRHDHAAAMLDAYLARFSIPPIYRAKLLLIRYEIAYLESDTLKMAELEAEMQAMPKPDLSYLSEMMNYMVEEKGKKDTKGYPFEEFQESNLDTDWFQQYLSQ